MKHTYLCKWPNDTISILTAENNFELFDKLDVEGDPTDERNKIYRLPEDFHLGTEIITGHKLDAGEPAISCEQEFEHNEVKMRRYRFPANICERVYKTIAQS
jgi:hypothetical protein